MRIAMAVFMQETSSFSPVKTTLETFKQYGLYKGDEILKHCRGGYIGGFMAGAKEAAIDWTPLPIIHGWAGANGPITADTLTFFEEKLAEGLKAIQPIDAMFFGLHGAGQAEGTPDSEGHLLATVREIIGDEIQLVVALDHHAYLTPLMVDKVDGLVAHRTQPHDWHDTGLWAGRMLFSMLQGKIRPTLAWRRIPLITHQEQFLTSKGPMKSWFDLARQMETRAGVVSTSPFPMQPWLDVTEAGWAAVVVTDGNLPLAERLAEELADKAWGLRDDFLQRDSITPEAAIQRAVTAEKGLVVLSDMGDSVYAGAAGDGNCLLKEMLRQGVTETALVPVVDRDVVATAIGAGLGQTIKVAIGGSLDPTFSQPVEITAKVGGIGGGQINSFDMGRAALLEVGSIKIVVSEERGISGNAPVVYNQFGVDVADARMLVLKAGSNWQAFQPYISEVVRVNTPGSTMSDIDKFDWVHLPRPIYPFDDLSSWRVETS